MTDRAPETIGELGILLVRIERAVQSMVTTQSFQAEQERTREEFRAVREDHLAWTGESRAAHGTLDTKIEAVKNELTIKIEAVEKAQRNADQERQRTKSARWFTAAGWLAAGLLGFGLGLLQLVIAGGP